MRVLNNFALLTFDLFILLYNNKLILIYEINTAILIVNPFQHWGNNLDLIALKLETCF